MTDIIQKTRQDYNKIAPAFSRTRYGSWPEFELFKKYIKDNQNILDWGCGNARLLYLLVDKKVKYFGIDISEELLKIARNKWRSEIKVGKAGFFWTGGKRRKKFSDNFFDLVFMVASFHHLPDEKTRLETLREMKRVMKPGGKLIIMVWNLGSDWARDKAKYNWKQVDGGFIIPFRNSQREVLAERYYHSFTPEELRVLLKKSGFKIDSSRYFPESSKGGRNIFVIATS